MVEICIVAQVFSNRVLGGLGGRCSTRVVAMFFGDFFGEFFVPGPKRCLIIDIYIYTYDLHI